VSRGDANVHKDGVFQLIQAHQVFHNGSQFNSVCCVWALKWLK